MSTAPKLKPLILGDLPLIHLQKCGLVLSAGPVHFGIPAQKHAIKRHPKEYALCEPHLHDVVLAPTHVGQSPHHVSDGFELVRAVASGGLIVLLAVKLVPTAGGFYMATSNYPIDSNTLERRVRKGHLIVL